MGVRMRHPDLEQEIEVASSAVPMHAGSGWQAVEGQADMGETLPPESQPFEGQPIIWLYHPDLDTKIRVAESAVPFHRERGWQVVGDTVEVSVEVEAEGDGLDGLTVAELREEANARDLPVSGTKAELLERLRIKQQAEPASVAEQTTEEE